MLGVTVTNDDAQNTESGFITAEWEKFDVIYPQTHLKGK